ncbi:poly-ribose polymerase [Trichodelitschia bisporula]|uniref:Poly [ADP-ribose] polymerase n=1 Tax=Trichodelitschia bisporula TaxID=703511 RepID=A0A6G1HX63_9PEZI|nr:poly-ribose polymerase [Trichodelitschia bisporula]
MRRRKSGPHQLTITAAIGVRAHFWLWDVANGPGTYTVYVGDDGTVWDASLNQTNVSGNNNKFYRIQLLESKVSKSYDVWTRWGRVGESGQSAMLKTGSIDAAMKLFDKKFKDKSGLKFADRFNSPRPNKYTFVERNYEPDNSDVEPSTEDPKTELELDAARTPESKLAKPVQQLMELIFNPFYMNSVMQDLNYDARKLPLGKLSKRTLERGYLCLKELAALILTPDPALTVMEVNGQKNDLTNAYYSTIPHDFGRSRPRIIADADILKREIALLESLSDMKVAEEIMKEAKSKQAGPVVNPLDRQFEGLGLSEMTPLDPTSQEFKELQDYLVHTRASTHALRYEVEEIFRIERNGEFARFDKSPYGSLAADRRLLWHGSRTTNFGGILSQGLRIAPPEAPVSGYMYGKGVYMADMSSKSANYCFHQQSGGVGLLLLCEAELGKPLFELTNADYDAGEKAQKAGCLTTLGRGQAGPAKWKDAGCVHPTLEGTTMPDVSDPPASLTDGYLQYNEYIVYDVEQIRLRYLFRVKMEYSWGN